MGSIRRDKSNSISPLTKKFSVQDLEGRAGGRDSSVMPGSSLFDDSRRKWGEGSGEKGGAVIGKEDSEEYFREEDWPDINAELGVFGDGEDEMDVGEQNQTEHL